MENLERAIYLAQAAMEDAKLEWFEATKSADTVDSIVTNKEYRTFVERAWYHHGLKDALRILNGKRQLNIP